MKLDRVLRLPEVLSKIQLSRATLYRYIARQEFPPPIRIGERAVAWRESDIQFWLSCYAGRDFLRRPETLN